MLILVQPMTGLAQIGKVILADNNTPGAAAQHGLRLRIRHALEQAKKVNVNY